MSYSLCVTRIVTGSQDGDVLGDRNTVWLGHVKNIDCLDQIRMRSKRSLQIGWKRSHLC
jgi:hypothetical protein